MKSHVHADSVSVKDFNVGRESPERTEESRVIHSKDTTWDQCDLVVSLLPDTDHVNHIVDILIWSNHPMVLHNENMS